LLAWAFGIPLLSVALYVAAGYGLGALTFAPAEVPDKSGGDVGVFVYSNGYHASLVLPLNGGGVDLSAKFPDGDFVAAPSGATHVMFGWGERDFYMNTRRLADLEAGVAIRAVAGLGGAVMHVTMIGEPVPGPMLRPLTLPVERYRDLVRFIDASFARDGSGRIRVHPGKGYGAYDAFYEGTGRYSLFYTCNEWVARALRAAGEPTGLWTPFASSLLRRP